MASHSEWVIEKTEARSKDGVVCAMQPEAAAAGAEILRRGGNAIDAAVATAFAITVVEPFMSSVGGVAWMIYRDAASGRTVCFDGSATLPRRIRPEMFELLPPGQKSGMYGWRATKDDAANTGWLTPAAPGTPHLLGEAHKRYGSLPWRDLLQPAIRLAENGFEVSQYVAMMLASEWSRLGRFPESRRTFFKANGAPYTPSLGMGPGDTLVQADLARTLKLIAEEGAEVVYKGEVARLITEDMARNGGLVDEAELANQQTRILEPSVVNYRGFEILGQLENSGYATIAEALQILEGFDIRRMGQGSSDAIHVEVESMRRAFVDRLRYLGDASLMPVPYRGVISRAYAAERRASIDARRATPGIEPGDPWPYEPTQSDFRPARSSAAGEGQTTHITVIDRDRNMVSLTSTLGAAFGSGVVIKGAGIVMNNATMWFDPSPGAVTSIGPGKRLMSATSHLLVQRDGKSFLAIGSPGGRRVITAVYQCIVNLIDFGLGMQAAISAPRFHTEGRETALSNRYPEEVIQAVRAMGHEVAVRNDVLGTSWFARPNGIMIDPSGELRGGVFQYTPATAIGI